MPSAKRTIGRLALYAGVVVLGLVVGVAVGALRSTIRGAMAEEAERADLQRFLETNLEGIEIGAAFPDIPFSLGPPQKQVLVRELLPESGVVLYVPHAGAWCQSVIDRLCTELKSAGKTPGNAAIITDEPSAGFAESLAKTHPGLEIILDTDGALARDYGVRTWPVAFYLDAQQKVTQITVMKK